MSRIHVGEPALVGNETKYVLDALSRGQLSQSTYVDAFEQAFAAHVGRRHAIACANGSVALHLALLALGLEPGDPVLVPTLTYVATANAVAIAGGVPVFVDVNPDTWTMDARDARRRLEALRLCNRPAAGILPVHLYGVPAPLLELIELAEEYDTWLVEDAAEAIGTTYRGRPAGAYGIASTFSFYGNKTLSTGEGGMVVLDDDELASRARLYRGQGMAPDRRYWHSVIGYNYRLGELAGAVGLAQLERVEWHVGRRREVVGWYLELLTDSVFEDLGIDYQTRASAEWASGEWLLTVLLPGGVSTDAIREFMIERDVETRPAFVCMHLLPAYFGQREDYPVAEDISRRGLSLPTHAGMTMQDVRRVVEALAAGVRAELFR